VIRVLITGIGGSIGIDVARSLRSLDQCHLIGSDRSWSGLQWGARLCDEVVELPSASAVGDDGFVEVLDRRVRQLDIDYVFVNPDSELGALARSNWSAPCRTSAPPPSVVALCLDKGATVESVGDADLFPGTRRVSDDSQVVAAFEALGHPLWLRPVSGAGGRRSMVVDSTDEAQSWIQYWRRRGEEPDWLIQEFLPGRNINWSGIYMDGALVGSAAMERLAYFLGDVTPTGVSGQVSRCATVDPDLVFRTADAVVRRLMAVPDGIFSVDFREDGAAVARVTEVNPRLAGRPWLYTTAGANLAAAAVGADGPSACGQAVIGVELYRQLDVDPLFRWPQVPLDK
jgi:biotin carboxylase